MRWSRAVPSDILVVCTGNVCRSPYIAARLAAELPDLTVTSAGTGALEGSPATKQIVTLLAGYYVSAPETVARPIARPDLRGARLVVTAERRHLVDVARLSREAGDRAFTLVELARLLRDAGSPTGLGVEGVRSLARAALRQGQDRDHDDDLADPYGRSDQDYIRMAEVADGALAEIVPALRQEAPA